MLLCCITLSSSRENQRSAQEVAGRAMGEETDLDSMSNSASPFLLPEGKRGEGRGNKRRKGGTALP